MTLVATSEIQNLKLRLKKMLKSSTDLSGNNNRPSPARRFGNCGTDRGV
jgi:hypothetical protein